MLSYVLTELKRVSCYTEVAFCKRNLKLSLIYIKNGNFVLCIVLNKVHINYLIGETLGKYPVYPRDKVLKCHYNCTSEANHVAEPYNFAAIQWLQYIVHVIFFSHDSRFVLLH